MQKIAIQMYIDVKNGIKLLRRQYNHDKSCKVSNEVHGACKLFKAIDVFFTFMKRITVSVRFFNRCHTHKIRHT